MPTTPTDDPLANSERTVGVRMHVGLDVDLLKSLKRDALLFDQIGIFHLTERDRIRLHPEERAVLDELVWLRDIGVTRAIPGFMSNLNNPTVNRRCLDALVAETGEPMDVAIPDERLLSEITRRLENVHTRGPGALKVVILRFCRIYFTL